MKWRHWKQNLPSHDVKRTRKPLMASEWRLATKQPSLGDFFIFTSTHHGGMIPCFQLAMTTVHRHCFRVWGAAVLLMQCPCYEHAGTHFADFTQADSIQALETPIFDQLLILLGHFHVELAFWGGDRYLHSRVGGRVPADGIRRVGWRVTLQDLFVETFTIGVNQILAGLMERSRYQPFVNMCVSKEEVEALMTIVENAPSDQTEIKNYFCDVNIDSGSGRMNHSKIIWHCMNIF